LLLIGGPFSPNGVFYRSETRSSIPAETFIS
jgi:hypothetical protein